MDLSNISKALILTSISYSEGVGIVVLEAVFYEAVFVVSKFIGSAEVVSEHQCGLVIDPLDVNGSADKIIKLIRDEVKLS